MKRTVFLCVDTYQECCMRVLPLNESRYRVIYETRTHPVDTEYVRAHSLSDRLILHSILHGWRRFD